MGIPVPGAPGFSAPDNISPAEFNAWLARVRYGGSSMRGDASSIPDDEPSEWVGPNDGTLDNGPQTELDRAAAVAQVDPAVVKSFLATMSQPSPSLNGSYTANRQAVLGENGKNGQPTNMAGYDALYPPNQYDLKSPFVDDAAHRQMFQQRMLAESKISNDAANSNAKSDIAGAKLGEANAKQEEAVLKQELARVYSQHPEYLDKRPQGPAGLADAKRALGINAPGDSSAAGGGGAPMVSAPQQEAGARPRGEVRYVNGVAYEAVVGPNGQRLWKRM